MYAGRVSEPYTCIGQDGAYASFVECHLISKGHFTSPTYHRVETSEDEGGTIAYRLDVGAECHPTVEGDA